MDQENNDNPSAMQPVASQAPAPSPGTALPTTKIPIPAEAEDSDLIEKEWVERAKEIVEHTKDDPYEQQKALSKMKADYMKKRYNRDIKIADD